MLVEQLHEALDGFSAAVEPLVGPAWREVPAFTLFFGAIFLVALALWRYAVGLERSKAAVLASCCMSSVHGLLSALGESLLDVGWRQGRTVQTLAGCKGWMQSGAVRRSGMRRAACPSCGCPAGGYEQLLQWPGFKLDMPNTHPQVGCTHALLQHMGTHLPRVIAGPVLLSLVPCSECLVPGDPPHLLLKQ